MLSKQTCSRCGGLINVINKDESSCMVCGYDPYVIPQDVLDEIEGRLQVGNPILTKRITKRVDKVFY